MPKVFRNLKQYYTAGRNNCDLNSTDNKTVITYEKAELQPTGRLCGKIPLPLLFIAEIFSEESQDFTL